MRPLSRLLFPFDGGDSLDHHACFSLRQQPGEQDGPFTLLPDNAEVSLQVCLSADGVAGGDLVFYGAREQPRQTPLNVSDGLRAAPSPTTYRAIHRAIYKLPTTFLSLSSNLVSIQRRCLCWRSATRLCIEARTSTDGNR